MPSLSHHCSSRNGTWAVSHVVCKGPSISLLFSILNSGHNVDRPSEGAPIWAAKSPKSFGPRCYLSSLLTIDFLPTIGHCAVPLIIRNPTPHFYNLYLQPAPNIFFMKNPRKRVRVNGAVGFVDPPSDEEIEVDINATSNSVTGEVKYDYSTSSLPVKRAKKASTSILQDHHATTPESAPASVKTALKESSISTESDPQEPKRKQVRDYTTLYYSTDSLLYLIGGLGCDGNL